MILEQSIIQNSFDYDSGGAKKPKDPGVQRPGLSLSFRCDQAPGLRDDTYGRTSIEEEGVRLQFPMGAFDLPVARRFPEIGKVNWNRVDFTRFSKTRNPAVTRYGFFRTRTRPARGQPLSEGPMTWLRRTG